MQWTVTGAARDASPAPAAPQAGVAPAPVAQQPPVSGGGVYPAPGQVVPAAPQAGAPAAASASAASAGQELKPVIQQQSSAATAQVSSATGGPPPAEVGGHQVQGSAAPSPAAAAVQPAVAPAPAKGGGGEQAGAPSPAAVPAGATAAPAATATATTASAHIEKAVAAVEKAKEEQKPRPKPKKKQQAPKPTEDDLRILPKPELRKLLGFVSENGEVLEPQLEDALLAEMESFLDSAIASGCSLAHRRRSDVLSPQDIAMCLERQHHMYIPGFVGGKSVRQFRRTAASEVHRERHAAVRKSRQQDAVRQDKEEEIEAAAAARGALLPQAPLVGVLPAATEPPPAKQQRTI